MNGGCRHGRGSQPDQVGYFLGQAGCRLERLPNLTEDDLGIPELVMMMATDLADLDHHEGTITLIANAVNWDGSPERLDEAYDDAVARPTRLVPWSNSIKRFLTAGRAVSMI
ncbi:hypothetical protein ACFQ1S_34440, partial [Kibdelosporangium lantanae]